MLDKDLLKRKINQIDGYLREIEPTLSLGTADIVSDVLKLRAVERNFQLVVDTMLDINSYIIAAENLQAPNSLQETFFILGRAGVLPAALLEEMAPVVGLLKIVHEYEGISTEKFVEDLKSGREQFGRYIVAIGEHMERQPE